MIFILGVRLGCFVGLWRARNKTNVRLPHRLSGHGAMSGEVIEFFPNGEGVLQIDDGEGHQRAVGAKQPPQARQIFS